MRQSKRDTKVEQRTDNEERRQDPENYDRFALTEPEISNIRSNDLRAFTAMSSGTVTTYFSSLSAA
jgi:hypothetical protein